MRWGVRALVLLVLGWMLWDLLFSDHGYFVYRQEQAQLQQLQDEIARLKAQREKLAGDILRLRNDPKALEELVHRDLGYVYPDEYMLVMPQGEDKTVEKAKK